jgi:hypothetical protein
MLVGDSEPTLQSITFVSGTESEGGTGGVSAPGATATDDGNDGPDGPDGPVHDTFTCNAPAAC